MKFLPTILASLLALTTAAPTSLETRYTTGSLRATYSHVYQEPNFTPSTTGKVIFSSNPQTSTISTFDIPASWAGRKVRVGFYLDASERLDFEQGIQIFDSLRAPGAGSSSGSNNRNQHIGTFVLRKGAEAVEASGSPSTYKEYQLPSAPGKVAFQVVPVWITNPTNLHYNTAVSGVTVTLL